MLGCAAVRAQQPFFVDDADTTARRRFHFEFSNQYSGLQRIAFPNLRQNASVVQWNYGLTDRLELGIDAPLIVIRNAPSPLPRTPVGLGDVNFTLKWNVRRERPDSRWPAFSIATAVETPTGDSDTQLGSGVTDYGCNTILQKSLSDRLTLRINNGLLFAGNTLTGAVGLRAQGLVYTGGASLTRQFSRGLLLGGELTGAVAEKNEVTKSSLQVQLGGKLALSRNVTLDFGLLRGWYVGAPRFAAQLGFSVDF